MATTQRTKRIVIAILAVVLAALSGGDIVTAVKNAAVAITQPVVTEE